MVTDPQMIDPTLKIEEDGTVVNLIEGESYTSCYCHYGHEQNSTVCLFCWAHGRRKPSDPEVPDVVLTQKNYNPLCPYDVHGPDCDCRGAAGDR